MTKEVKTNLVQPERKKNIKKVKQKNQINQIIANKSELIEVFF